MHEVEGVLAESGASHNAVLDQRQSGRALFLKRGGGDDGSVRAVSRDEVDERGVVLQELAKLVPVFIGLQIAVVCLTVDLVAHEVERRHPRITAARNVERRKVERQAQKVVAQGTCYELIDLV